MKALTKDEYFMYKALTEARAAAARGETPVGAVIVKDGKIIASAGNCRERGKNAVLHAELSAISQACRTLNGWRLVGCTLYVTLEPCPMCAGAIMNARIPRLVFGAPDIKCGAVGGMFDLFSLPVNHKPEIVSGVLRDECGDIIKTFFRARRNGKGYNPSAEWKRKFTVSSGISDKL